MKNLLMKIKKFNFIINQLKIIGLILLKNLLIKMNFKII